MANTERLNQILADPDANLDVLLAALASVDQSAPPEHEVVQAFDLLAESAQRQTSSPTVPQTLDFVFGHLGFSGNATDYYDPANSLIHDVLRHRRGIPITLAAVASEIGRRLGNRLRPVGLPGHVLLAADAEPGRWYDPFNRGAILNHQDCVNLFGRFHPVAAFEPWMLDAMNNETFAVRTLNNLRVAFGRSGRLTDLVPVLELRANLAISGADDRVDFANLLGNVGRFDQAADEFELLIELDPDHAEEHQAKARSYRAHRN